ncbi:MAG: hypothetical protein Q8O76_06685 [Chloroflexota bacterium]|nr:hypothetical protein [Chloroflexota bacterium]
MSPQPRLSYDLNEEMLRILAQEFRPAVVVDQFTATLKGSRPGDVEKVAAQVFGDFGKRWMKRSLELGEQFPDATYETLKQIMEKTGTGRFPMVPQRIVEIAYLGVLSLLYIKVVQNNGQRLAYRIPQCDIYQALTQKGTDVGGVLSPSKEGRLPCRHACLAALDTLFKELNMPAKIEMEAQMPQQGFCQFAATRV